MEDFPGWDRILLGRDDREAFEFCLEHIMKGVGSVRKWDRVVGVPGTVLNDWLTACDEAWFVVVVENYWEVWDRQFKSEGPVDCLVSAKWTGRDKSNNRKGQGKSNLRWFLFVWLFFFSSHPFFLLVMTFKDGRVVGWTGLMRFMDC